MTYRWNGKNKSPALRAGAAPVFEALEGRTLLSANVQLLKAHGMLAAEPAATSDLHVGPAAPVAHAIPAVARVGTAMRYRARRVTPATFRGASTPDNFFPIGV